MPPRAAAYARCDDGAVAHEDLARRIAAGVSGTGATRGESRDQRTDERTEQEPHAVVRRWEPARDVGRGKPWSMGNDECPIGARDGDPLSQTSRAIQMNATLLSTRSSYFMRLAMREAERALEHGDVPIGAVVVRDGEVLGARTQRARAAPGPHRARRDRWRCARRPRSIGSWRVLDAVLYVTLEPCAMCAGAIVLARVPRVVFGATRSEGGRLRQRAGRDSASRGSTTGLRSRAGCSRRSAARCSARSSPRGAERVRGLPSRRRSSSLLCVARRGGRAVECGGLENRCASYWRTGSSNLPPSVFAGFEVVVRNRIDGKRVGVACRSGAVPGATLTECLLAVRVIRSLRLPLFVRLSIPSVVEGSV